MVRCIVRSTPADKPKIAFHAAMMTVQNFGFMIMYYDTWGNTPNESVCDDTRLYVAWMVMTCFCEAWLCIGMGMGGYADNRCLFTFYWLCHLVGGGSYIFCTAAIPLARYSADGMACARLAPINGDRIQLVYIMHAALFLGYVGNMLSITYYSFLKPTCFSKKVPSNTGYDVEAPAGPAAHPPPMAEDDAELTAMSAEVTMQRAQIAELTRMLAMYSEQAGRQAGAPIGGVQMLPPYDRAAPRLPPLAAYNRVYPTGGGARTPATAVRY